MELVVGALFIIWGGISVIHPEIAISLRRKVAEKLYGADFRPSEKTVKIQRYFGILFLILGFLLITRQFG